MEYKKLTTFVGILALLVLSLSAVSAAMVLNPDSLTYSINQGSSLTKTFTIENAAENRTIVNITATSSDLTSGSNTISASNILVSNIPSSIENSTTSDPISVQINVPSGQATGTYTGAITMEGEHNETSSSIADRILNLTVTVTSSSTPTTDPVKCSAGEKGDLKLDITIDNFDGDDDEWAPLDEIEIEVELENDGDEEIEDVTVELFIFDENEDVTDEFDFDDEEIDFGDIDEDDEETDFFKINEVPADEDLPEGSYTLYIKAYAEDAESNQCIITEEPFDIKKLDDQAIIAHNFLDSGVEANAGDTVEATATIVNVGEEDEERVLVRFFNRELGIDQVELIRNLDVGDKEDLTLDFEIPSNAEEKTYNIDIVTYYDYDDGDVLDTLSYDENSFDDLDEDFFIPLKVLESTPQTPQITANLISDAKVGNDLVVQVSITNRGSSPNTVVSVEGVESWGELVDIAPVILQIPEGETKQSTITINPTKEGTQSFDIVVSYDGEETTQPVSVTISEPEASGLLTGAFAGVGTAVLALIVGIGVLLILIIIVLAVKLARTPRAQEF